MGVVVALGVVAFLVQEAVGALRRRKLAHIPGPPGWPVVGHIPYLLSEPWMRFAQFATRHGGASGIYKLWVWHKLFVVINRPELVQRVFNTKRDIYPKDTWSYKFFE